MHMSKHLIVFSGQSLLDQSTQLKAFLYSLQNYPLQLPSKNTLQEFLFPDLPYQDMAQPGLLGSLNTKIMKVTFYTEKTTDLTCKNSNAG